MDKEKYSTEVQSLAKQFFEFENQFFDIRKSIDKIIEKEEKFLKVNSEPISVEKSFELKLIQNEKFECEKKLNERLLRQNIIRDYILECIPDGITISIKLDIGLFSIKKIIDKKTNSRILDTKSRIDISA